MRLSIAGCDHTGKTSLAKNVAEWMHKSLSSRCAADVAGPFAPGLSLIPA